MTKLFSNFSFLIAFITFPSITFCSSSLDIQCIPEQSICKIINFSHTPECYRKILELKNTIEAQAKTLYIANSVLSTFPHILGLVFKDLVHLHVDNCGLRALTGNDIGGFKYLREITAANNNIKRINEDIFDLCKQVSHIDFRNNKIDEIDIGSLLNNKNLKAIKLKGNSCIDKNILFGDRLDVALATKEIVENCHPQAFKPDLSKRRCILTAWLLGSYSDKAEKKRKEKEEWKIFREKTERENRERIERENRERIERENRERAERENRERIERENRERTERENRQKEEQRKREIENKKKTQAEKKKKDLKKFENELKKKLEQEIFSKITVDDKLKETIVKQIVKSETGKCQKINVCGKGVKFNQINYATVLKSLQNEIISQQKTNSNNVEQIVLTEKGEKEILNPNRLIYAIQIIQNGNKIPQRIGPDETSNSPCFQGCQTIPGSIFGFNSHNNASQSETSNSASSSNHGGHLGSSNENIQSILQAVNAENAGNTKGTFWSSTTNSNSSSSSSSSSSSTSSFISSLRRRGKERRRKNLMKNDADQVQDSSMNPFQKTSRRFGYNFNFQSNDEEKHDDGVVTCNGKDNCLMDYGRDVSVQPLWQHDENYLNENILKEEKLWKEDKDDDEEENSIKDFKKEDEDVQTKKFDFM